MVVRGKERERELTVIAVYHVNITFIYYDAKNANNNYVDNAISIAVSKLGSIDDRPADLILPISANGNSGLWFQIESESELNDEFWYSNPPDSYIQMNNLNTRRGHVAYREVLLKMDENLVSFVPFPVVSTGGINPLFWEPVVSIGAFDLPSYDIDLTPFFGASA
ncbi:hypothetical protein RND71_031426 [Anisodus tanguticus]|uniref:Peptide N-acetyl-beta-D-glucosaminyl asparaginase amidase A N-terminal domain-containing protein n=1 Tax=Anisodus tanguticus TaxID=243964 RepID=A0AAE1V381_9SOLA|nr:hypothetical protein RND71_031426 [Anisodus tanguticus]